MIAFELIFFLGGVENQGIHNYFFMEQYTPLTNQSYPLPTNRIWYAHVPQDGWHN